MFRYRPGIRCTYKRQAYIYAISLNFDNLAESQKKKIRALCKKWGKKNEAALFDAVTTEASATAICLKHRIASTSTLYELVKAYYEHFPIRI